MKDGMKYLLGAFLVIMLGVILLGVYSNLSSEHTSKVNTAQTVSMANARLAGGAINTTYPFTITNGYNTWRSDYASDCLTSALVSYGNASTAFTDTTDYIYNSNNGTLYLKNTAEVNGTAGGSTNTTTAVYTYCPDGYITSWGNTVQKVSVGLFVLLILGAAISFLYIALKEMK
jgi:hypothetical protein